MNQIIKAVESLTNKPSEIVSGGARGADQIGEIYANTFNIPIKLFRPDWNEFGKAVGPLRNLEMAKYADALILIWDRKSRGSASMLKYAKEYKLEIIEILI